MASDVLYGFKRYSRAPTPATPTYEQGQAIHRTIERLKRHADGIGGS